MKEDQKTNLEERILHNLHICSNIGDKTSAEFQKYLTEVKTLAEQYKQQTGNYFRLEKKNETTR